MLGKTSHKISSAHPRIMSHCSLKTFLLFLLGTSFLWLPLVSSKYHPSHFIFLGSLALKPLHNYKPDFANQRIPLCMLCHLAFHLLVKQKKKNPKNQKEKKMERLRHFHILPPVPTGNTLILSIDINHGMCCRI